MIGSLQSWTKNDAIQEMMKQRNEMGKASISFDERMQICESASLLYICSGDESEQLHNSFLYHFQEMNKRMHMAVGM